MKIEFVNHASFIIESGPIRMISDPWMEGVVFNKGWALLSPTKLQYDDFKDITHIWFSHEHPDHFSPPNIFKIPAEYRGNITVLYQSTLDGRVAAFCRKAGFADVIELPHGQAVEIAPGFELTCQPYDDDSWLLIRTPGCSILNLNDCLIFEEESAREIRDNVGEIDVMLTQFSISSWDGNREERQRRFDGARNMLDKLIMQIRLLKPKYTIPFASYVWFCHEENFWINEAHNRIDEVTARIAKETESRPVVLYPGDDWVIGEPHSPDAAVARYQSEFDNLEERELVKAEDVSREDLLKSGVDFCNRLAESSGGMLRLRLSEAKWSFHSRMRKASGLLDKLTAVAGLPFLSAETAHVYAHDHRQSYAFDFAKGLRPSNRSREECDLEMGAESLQYALNNNWGGESLLVNGRFAELRPDGRESLWKYFGAAQAVNVGRQGSWKGFPAAIWKTISGSKA